MYRIEPYEHELNSTAIGREILELITCHFEEVSGLINHNRHVIVTWQRNKGAEFFAQLMGSGFDPEMAVKKEIDGIQMTSLIRRMAVVLQDHGSPSLIKAVDKALLVVLGYAESCNSLAEAFQKLRQHG
jgi:hypothetical protein